MKLLMLILLLTMSNLAFAGKCKVKYEVEIFEYNNTSHDYYHCRGNSFEASVIRRDSKTIRDVSSFKECKELAKDLVGEQAIVEYLIMVVPYGQNHLYATCKGKITKVRKVKFKS